MVHGIPNITVPVIGYPMSQGIKMSLPVDPASLLYSHFEHVSGVVAPKGTQGVSITKLNLLDVLIEQLNQVKKDHSATATGIQSGNPDALIENYRNQIQQAKAASTAMPYIRSPSAQSGAVFSLAI